jgi:hypothetical protein
MSSAGIVLRLGNQTIAQQIGGFGIFAIIMIALASFKPTERIAFYLIAMVAIIVVVKFASGAYQKLGVSA